MYPKYIYAYNNFEKLRKGWKKLQRFSSIILHDGLKEIIDILIIWMFW